MDERDTSTWAIGDWFEVVDIHTGSAKVSIGDRVVLLENDGSDFKKYTSLTRDGVRHWWIYDTDLRKL